jgi:cytochrome c oxidase subunit 2
VWFQAEQTGEYVLGCAELCGLGHYRMKGAVTVHERVAYDRWLQSGGALALVQPVTESGVVAAQQPAGHAGH